MPDVQRKPRKPRNLLVRALAAAAALTFVAGVVMQDGSGAPAPTGEDVTRFVADIRAGTVTSARIDDSSGVVTLTTASGSREVLLPRSFVADATSLLVDAKVPLVVGRGSAVSDPMRPSAVERSDRDRAGSGLVFLSFVLGCSALGVHIRRRSQRSLDAAVAENPSTRFADVAGCDEARSDLQEVVSFLKDPARYEKMGARIPRGVLLCGPPGTGKTLLAKAVAGEAGVAFHAVTGSDFVEQYVGVGPRRVRELFERARLSSPAIVFIDEIDVLTRKRSSSGDAAGQEHDSTLVALLAEMDGFRDSNVVVIAATNRPDVMDPAALRPGRFDRRVEVPLPDRLGREQILAVHTDSKPLSGSVDLHLLARRTPGFSGAQLESLVNEACIEAVRQDLAEVTPECFDAAVALVAMGRARTSALVTPRDREITAWHEAGHAVAALVQDDADDPVHVSIVPRGPAGGVTWMAPGDEVYFTGRQARARLVTMLAGRAAEEILLGGDATQGASSDLEVATSLAQGLVARYGMTDLGLAVKDPALPAAQAGVEGLLSEALEGAREILEEHRALLGAVARRLLDVEDLTRSDLEALRDFSVPEPRVAR